MFDPLYFSFNQNYAAQFLVKFKKIGLENARKIVSWNLSGVYCSALNNFFGFT